MSLAPGTRIGPYEVVSMVAAGGMGEVYKAHDFQLGRSVALKLLHVDSLGSPSAVRVEREAKTASALNHPNICHVYAVGVAPDGQPFIAMEYVEGETLRSRLATRPLEIRESVEIAVQIASALSATHAAGIVHRDIKPDNLMVTADGLVKVLDFGLAKAQPPFSPDSSQSSTRTMAQTDAGAIVGTVAYMSPEQARGQRVDARTDIWSLGAVMYEMITGRPPFSGATGSDVVASILEREPLPLHRFAPNAPAELVRIVGKALRKHADDRYQTAKDLMLDLKAFRAQQESQASVSQPVHARGTGALAKSAIALVATLIVLGAIVAGYRWKSGRASDDDIGSPQFTLKSLTNAAGLTLNPTVSTDGRLIAYASDRAGDNLDLWVQQIAGGEPLRLTTNAADDVQPSFSPDGTTVVFRSDRDGGGIYRVSALGGPEQLIVAAGRGPRVSPDGRWMTYWIGRPTSGAPNTKDAAKVFVIEFDGGTPRQIAPQFAFARYPLWSSDSSQILFFGNREAGKEPDWCLASLKDPTQVRCVGAAKVIGQDGHLHDHHAAADWVGDRAVYLTEDGDTIQLAEVRLDAAAGRLVGPPVRLTSGAGEPADPVLGYAGDVVFVDMRDATDIWSVRRDPATGRSLGQAQALTSDPASDFDVRSSGSGGALAFSSDRAGKEIDVWVRDLRTNKETRITSGHYAFWPALDWNAERVAFLQWEAGQANRRELHVVTLSTHQNETLCTERCGTSTPIWNRDGSRVLITDGNVIRAFSLARHKFTDVVQRPPFKVWEPNVSPDGKRLLFLVREHETLGRIVVAPLHDEGPAQESEWSIVSADGTEDKPRWSPDGRIAYFTSERDGFLCIWGQPFDPLTNKPIGASFAAFHSHTARRSLKEMSLSRLGIGVTTNQFFFNQLERTGNLWMLSPVVRKPGP